MNKRVADGSVNERNDVLELWRKDYHCQRFESYHKIYGMLENIRVPTGAKCIINDVPQIDGIWRNRK